MNQEQLIQQLKAVSDSNRLKLLAALKKGECCVCDFVPLLQISQPAVSQQLKKLKDASIIQERKEGAWRYYRLADSLSPVIEAILEELEPICIQTTCAK